MRSEIALGARKSPQTSRGHRYLIANLIYRFRFTSFFRHRYAFSLQLSELALASRRIAAQEAKVKIRAKPAVVIQRTSRCAEGRSLRR